MHWKRLALRAAVVCSLLIVAQTADAIISQVDGTILPVGGNLQACLAPELVDRNVDYYLDDFSVDVASRARQSFGHSEYWFHPPGCDACGHRGVCPGLYRDTVHRYGQAEYVAVDRVGLASAEDRRLT